MKRLIFASIVVSCLPLAGWGQEDPGTRPMLLRCESVDSGNILHCMEAHGYELTLHNATCPFHNNKYGNRFVMETAARCYEKL